jgi:predicted AAA+ superfamily ATPase
MERSLEKLISKDLNKKMVFVGGPRQVGKSTLAKHLLPKSNSVYINFDTLAGKESVLKQEYPKQKFIVYDEIHKFRQWRNFLKGLFDQHGDTKKILVTGSARLDYYRFSGDSLQGRYFYYRLHPLSVAELKINSQKDFDTLFHLGGFPEPFFSGSEKEATRWSRDYRHRFIHEEITALELTQNLSSMEMLMMRLPDLVGSPLSINALREDLEINHATVAKWLQIFERLYGIFRLPPFGAPKIRAVKKETKHYHFDWSLVREPAFRFENLVACHLLKWVHFLEDTEGKNIELRYFRDTDRREVDFIVVENQKPTWAIEVKLSDSEVSPHLKYFKAKFPTVEAVQVSFQGKKDYITKDGIRVLPWHQFLPNFK